MTQKRFWNWKDDDSTMALANWIRSFMAYGVYYGFDANIPASAGMSFVMNGALTGTQYVNQALTMISNVSVVCTKQGVAIQEDANISVPVSLGHGLYDRIDTVVVEHQFQEITGGSVAIYLIVEGTPSASPIATPVTSTKQTIIGYLKIPANCTNISTNPGVTWTKQSISAFDNDQTIVRTNKDQEVTAPKTFTFQRGVVNTGVFSGNDLQLNAVNFHTIAYINGARKIVNRVTGGMSAQKGGSWVYVFTRQKLTLISADNGGRFISSAGTPDAGTGKNIHIDANEGFFLLSDGVPVSGNPSYYVMKGGEAGKNNGPCFTSMIRTNKGPDRTIGADGELDMEIYAGGGNFLEVIGGAAQLKQIKSCSAYDNGGVANEEFESGGTVIRLRNVSGSSFTVINGFSTPTAKFKPIYTHDGLSLTFQVGGILELLEDEIGWRVINYISTTANPFPKRLDDLVDVTITGPLYPGSVLYYDGTDWKNALFETLVTNTERTYIKAQSLGFVGGNPANVNTTTGVITLNGNGNNYQIFFPAGDVAITNLVKTGGQAFPYGTIIKLIYVGEAGAGNRSFNTGPTGTSIQSYRLNNSPSSVPFQFNDVVSLIFRDTDKWSIIAMNGEMVRRVDTINTFITTTNPSGLITMVIDIGSWNMTVGNQKNVSHSIPDITKIIGISVMLVNDSGTMVMPLLSGAINNSGSFNHEHVRGSAEIFTSIIQLGNVSNTYGGDTSVAAGLSTFQSTAASRGKIILTLLP